MKNKKSSQKGAYSKQDYLLFNDRCAIEEIHRDLNECQPQVQVTSRIILHIHHVHASSELLVVNLKSDLMEMTLRVAERCDNRRVTSSATRGHILFVLY